MATEDVRYPENDGYTSNDARNALNDYAKLYPNKILPTPEDIIIIDMCKDDEDDQEINYKSSESYQRNLKLIEETFKNSSTQLPFPIHTDRKNIKRV